MCDRLILGFSFSFVSNICVFTWVHEENILRPCCLPLCDADRGNSETYQIWISGVTLAGIF